MPGFARARGRKDRCLISFSVRAMGLRGVDLRGGRLLVFAFCQSVCVCAEKYFWLLFFFSPQTERSVINISRLSKQKQTIKLTSRIKVWKQSLFFPSLSYFFGPSRVIPRRAFYLCKHSLVCLTEDGLFAVKRCSSAFNVAAENIINTGPYYIPPNDHIGQRDTSHIHVNLHVQPHGHTHTHTGQKKKKNQ